MNLGKLHETLVQAARTSPPSERVPFAFEQRILARLRATPLPEPGVLWARALWRSAALCFCIMVLLGAWVRLAPPRNPAPGDFSQELENTLLAASDQDQSADSAW